MYLEVLSHYRPTKLEQVVQRYYEQLGIEHPEDINIERIAHELGITLFNSDYDSMCGEKNGKMIIVLQQDLSDQERKEVFFHELTHLLLHSGNQLTIPIPLRDIQERDANKMPYYWLMPTFMIAKTYLPDDLNRAIRFLADYFDVTLKFAKKRIDMLVARLEMIAAERQFAIAMENAPKYGRDYDNVMVIGRSELFYKNGKVVGHLVHLDA